MLDKQVRDNQMYFLKVEAFGKLSTDYSLFRKAVETLDVCFCEPIAWSLR